MTQYLTTEQKIDEIHQQITQNDSLLDFLSIVSMVFGFYNAYLNRQQIDNNTIMKELNKQDKEYFEKIIAILNEIKGEQNDDK